MKIEHIALYVNDLEGARDFFVKYFGAKSNEGYHNQKTDFRLFYSLKSFSLQSPFIYLSCTFNIASSIFFFGKL